MTPHFACRRGFRAFLVGACLAPLAALAQGAGPLTIKEQGSFFVGGEHRTISEPAAGVVPAQSGEITVNQMYVQYQIPLKAERHLPVVFVHGCCLSSKTWETTPDGRMGWNEYFVRKNRPVYLADQVSRARSGFDPSAFNEVHAGTLANARMPGILDATHEFAWTVFRFGPKYGEGFADEQFPLDSVEELYKQMIPDLNSTLPANLNPTLTQMAALGVKLKGAVLVGHSESGFFPEGAALVDPSGIRGMVTIEMRCDTALTPAQLGQLAKIPTLVMFGDHLDGVKGAPFSWMDALNSCNTFVDQLKKTGGDAEVMYLPAMGIKGNSHMLMQDKNSNQLADLVIAWIDAHVESGKARAH
jgi:pimeloyl-ACP methyl ester carboxylesterase